MLYLSHLENKKNLIAFSNGVDSTALFWKLLSLNIKCDIAIVDYGQREQSKLEVKNAYKIAVECNVKIYHSVYDKTDFNEKQARDFRYEFFENIIKEEGYDNLLMGHHLNDRLEWFFMQLTKGAGLPELLSLQGINKKDNYTIIRPFINTPKQDLLEYLNDNDITYFVDETNLQDIYTRNKFRKYYSNPLIESHLDGIKNSFKYLDRDNQSLDTSVILNDFLYKMDSYYCIKHNNDVSSVRLIDNILKNKFGLLVTKDFREYLIEDQFNTVVNNIAITIDSNNIIHIAPYVISKDTMPKFIKEKFRVEKIPPKIRPFLFNNFY